MSRPPLRRKARTCAAISFFVFLTLSPFAQAQHKGLSFQAVLKKPDGTYPTVSGLSVTLQVLDPVSNCVLREELHSSVNISNGYINLVLGSSSAATPGGRNPAPVLSIPEVMDNSKPKTGLTCVDTNNNITSSGFTYTPGTHHARKLRLRAVIGGDTVVADFNMRAIAYAVNSETLEGKTATEFVQTSTNISQTNVESVFARYSVLDAILNGTYAGNAATATALATAPGACPAGQYMTAMTASGAITCGTPTGSVTNVSSANAYLSVATGTTTPVLTLNVGTSANTVAAGNDARFSDARVPTGSAGGDLSGTYPNPTVAKINGKSVVLTTPAAGEVLKYDGTNFVNGSAADVTKLPLAGGTMSGTIDMNSQNLTNAGYITMASGKNLHLSNNSSDPSGLVAADKGKIWFNSTSGQIKYWDGTSALPLGIAGTGTFVDGGNTFGAAATVGTNDNFALNLETNNTPRITIDPTGLIGLGTTSPGASLDIAGDTIRLQAGNVNKASTISSINGGTLLLQGYNNGASANLAIDANSSITANFNGTEKFRITNSGLVGIGTNAPNSALDVLGAITGRGIAAPAVSTTGQGIIYFDSTANKFRVSQNGGAYQDLIGGTVNFSDIASKPTTLAGYGITDAQSSTLGDGKILVGNSSNVATAVTMSGDATLSNTGALTLATVPVSKGGTGLTSFTGDRLITTSAAGAMQTSSCGLNQVLSFTAAGAITCANVSTLSGGYVNGGNSFAGAATIGTNDTYDLSFKTDNTSRLTILSTGNVGIGTASPDAALDVRSDIGASPSGWSANSVIGNPTNNGHAVRLGFAGGNTAFQTAQIESAGGNFDGYLDFRVRNSGSGMIEAMRIDQSGYVGIATASPSSPLTVAGSIVSRTPANNISTAIDFSKGNAQTTSAALASGGTTTFTLNNLDDGGVYALMVTSTTNTTFAFSAAGLTFNSGSTSLTTTGSSKCLFTFVRLGTVVYVTLVQGF